MILLDFGASREYSKDFIDKYVKVIKAASENDRETVLVTSKELGFLTGYEDQVCGSLKPAFSGVVGEEQFSILYLCNFKRCFYFL